MALATTDHLFLTMFNQIWPDSLTIFYQENGHFQISTTFGKSLEIDES
jgi:hypothetical protein